MSRFLVLVIGLSGCLIDEEFAETEQEAASPPWKQPAKWPLNVQTPRFIVHYQATGDLATAQGVLADVDDAWTKQITQGGARAPLNDGGFAGPDGRFDVYLQRGLGSLYVAATVANAATPYDDFSTAMVLDPWDPVYGGAEMRANAFHEFRHASQAVDDWYEQAWVFEAEATVWEAVYYGYDRISYVWADYQLHPEWTPFKNDRYATWYMYGGGMFFAHLRKTVFNNSLAFTNDMWLGSRSAGTNEPDFVDALGPILAARGTTVFDQIVSFARARWYTGSRANATIIDGAASIAEVTSGSHVRASGAQRTTFLANPEVLGTKYTTITAAPTDTSTLRISLSNIDAKALPRVQVVGQTNGDRVLDFTAGPATVNVVGGKVTLAVTMLPSNGQFDVDSPGTQLYKATVNIDR